jgi:hypothetical protein
MIVHVGCVATLPAGKRASLREQPDAAGWAELAAL